MTKQPSPTPANAYLICKYGGYYRPDAAGYTMNKVEAGRFTLAEAISHSHPNGPGGPRDGITYILDDSPPPASAPKMERATVSKMEIVQQSDIDCWKEIFGFKDGEVDLTGDDKRGIECIARHRRQASASVAAEVERECQAVWRCAIGDATVALDALKNQWINSKRKGEREAGAALSGILDLVFAARDPAPRNYNEASANGNAMIKRARLAIKGADHG